MINLHDWFEPIREYFESRGIYLTGAEGRVGSEFVNTIGSREMHRIHNDYNVELSVLAPSRDEFEAALDEDFLYNFELAIISTSYGINRDGWCEGTVTFHQTEPRVEWVEL